MHCNFVADNTGLSVIASQICEVEIPRKFGLIVVQGHFKVIDLGVNRKRICDFLLVINNNN